MAHPITLNPGAPSEITAEPGAISIPDLWHIAQELKATGATIVDFGEDGEFVEKLAGDYVLDCWHLAHAMRRYLIDHPEAEPRLRPSGDVCQECGGTFRVGDCAQRVRHGSPTIRAEFVHLRCLTTYQTIHGDTVKDAE
jgi:hypothetical protein